ncbi:hypothetical protein MRX96_028474 [Rhipicephalus microplus]
MLRFSLRSHLPFCSSAPPGFYAGEIPKRRWDADSPQARKGSVPSPLSDCESAGGGSRCDILPQPLLSRRKKKYARDSSRTRRAARRSLAGGGVVSHRPQALRSWRTQQWSALVAATASVLLLVAVPQQPTTAAGLPIPTEPLSTSWLARTRRDARQTALGSSEDPGTITHFLLDAGTGAVVLINLAPGLDAVAVDTVPRAFPYL